MALYVGTSSDLTNAWSYEVDMQNGIMELFVIEFANEKYATRWHNFPEDVVRKASFKINEAERYVTISILIIPNAFIIETCEYKYNKILDRNVLQVLSKELSSTEALNVYLEKRKQNSLQF